MHSRFVVDLPSAVFLRRPILYFVPANASQASRLCLSCCAGKSAGAPAIAEGL